MGKIFLRMISRKSRRNTPRARPPIPATCPTTLRTSVSTRDSYPLLLGNYNVSQTQAGGTIFYTLLGSCEAGLSKTSWPILLEHKVNAAKRLIGQASP